MTSLDVAKNIELYWVDIRLIIILLLAIPYIRNSIKARFICNGHLAPDIEFELTGVLVTGVILFFVYNHPFNTWTFNVTKHSSGLIKLLITGQDVL